MNTPTATQIADVTDLYREDACGWDSLEAFVVGQFPRHPAAFHANLTAAIRAAL